MRYILTLLSVVFYLNAHSQVITVEYREHTIFGIEKNRGLIEQWENNDIIWGKGQGYGVGEGFIRYEFDFNRQTVRCQYITSSGDVERDGTWLIVGVISEWDEDEQHFSCYATTEYGLYFYELTENVLGEVFFFMYSNNDLKEDIWALPSLDWDKYGIGVGSIDEPLIIVR